MKKASHRCRRIANQYRESADRWLKLLKKYPNGTDAMRMCAARQYRSAMAEARRYDKLALEYQEKGR